MARLEQFLPIDPGTPAGGWHSQAQQQQALKIKAGEDADELDDDDDDDDDDDEDDDPDADKTPEQLAAELKAVRKSLEKANGQSAKRRKTLREREAELETLRKGGKGKPKRKDDDDDEDTLDADALLEQGRGEGKKEAIAIVKRSKVETALARAGVTDDKALARLARMVDLDELDYNDDGTVDGIDDAIDDLKADMPQLFAARRKRQSVAGESDRDGGESKRTPKTASERQAASLLGRK